MAFIVTAVGLWFVTMTFKRGFWPVLWTWLGCVIAAFVALLIR